MASTSTGKTFGHHWYSIKKFGRKVTATKKSYGCNRSFSPITLLNRQEYYITKWGNCMRMQDIEITNTGKLELDIMELPKSCVIIFSKGKAKVAELPPFAETKIITDQGLVTRVKFDEGEKF